MSGSRPPKPAQLSPLCLLLLVGLALPVFADEQTAERARAELEALQAQIQTVTRELESARGELDSLQRQLRDSEQRLGTLARDIAENRQAIETARTELAELQARGQALEAQRDQQQERIARELRTAWQMGRQGEARVLLNQEDPHLLARVLAYYRYIFQARQSRLETFRATLAELAGVREDIDARADELETRQTELALQRDTELALQEERARVVARLDAEISDRDQELRRLRQDREELEQLLEALEKAVVDLELPDDARPFQEARGELPWPVSGKRANSFGSRRGSGGLHWQGLNLIAEAGTPVHAIHHGRVVYADWLRGLGLLLILDHGDGYMSLYGHNESLLREVGEWVNAGTPVSTVGTSGGLQDPALYFEIRRQGKPVDPVAWCR